MEIEEFIGSYGLIAVFAGTFVEGETVAITGGVLAHRHLLVLWQVVLTVVAAAFLSDAVVFFLGRRYRNHRWIRSIMARKSFARALAALDKGPMRLAVIYRFIPGLRIAGPLALAQSRIGTRAFLGLAGSTAIVWGSFYAIVGQGVGNLIARAFGELARVEHVLIGAAVALILVGLLGLMWRLRGKGRPTP